MKPTMYLRVQERMVIQKVNTLPLPDDHMEGMVTQTVPVRIIQQFWEHYDGKESAGDMFTLLTGSWVDLPVVKA
jgi:hypothetical protein